MITGAPALYRSFLGGTTRTAIPLPSPTLEEMRVSTPRDWIGRCANVWFWTANKSAVVSRNRTPFTFSPFIKFECSLQSFETTNRFLKMEAARACPVRREDRNRQAEDSGEA